MGENLSSLARADYASSVWLFCKEKKSLHESISTGIAASIRRHKLR